MYSKKKKKKQQIYQRMTKEDVYEQGASLLSYGVQTLSW